MTIYGIDVSSWQKGLSVAAVQKQGYSFLIARCSLGNTPDTEYPRFMAEAKQCKMLFSAYHFLKSSKVVNLDAQVKTIVASVRDKSIPVMMDIESNAPDNSHPTYADAIYVRTALAKLGISVKLEYFPHWYWQSVGSPPIQSALVASSYGSNASGYASVTYPGDTSDRWSAYGGKTPVLLQFDSRDVIDGYTNARAGTGFVDADAFRGTLSQLKMTGLFKDWSAPVVTTPAPTPPPPLPLSPPWNITIAGDSVPVVPNPRSAYHSAAYWLVNPNYQLDKVLSDLDAIKKHLGIA